MMFPGPYRVRPGHDAAAPEQLAPHVMHKGDGSDTWRVGIPRSTYDYPLSEQYIATARVAVTLGTFRPVELAALVPRSRSMINDWCLDAKAKGHALRVAPGTYRFTAVPDDLVVACA